MANTQIYNVLPGQPFGRGRHGSATLSSDPHTRRTGTGTSGTKTLTINSGGFTNGDLILIHQSRGLSSASEVNWELNRIETGGGGTSLTLKNNLARNYTNAQVIDVKEYINLTLNQFTVSGWNESTGGICAIAVLNELTWNGTIVNRGGDGSASGSDTGGRPGVAGGFRGGWNSMDGSHAQQGEGYPGAPVESQSKNGNGAGGGNPSGDTGGGGGGGASAGSAASTGSAQGGDAVGSTDLTSAIFGGGGGGGRNDGDQQAGGGGSGGGGVFIWCQRLTLSSGGIDVRGGTGGPSTSGATSGGGGGGGGFGFINYAYGTVSSSFLASAGNGQNAGGNGGAGRFRINYGVSTTGTTSPAASTNNDKNLTPSGGGAFLTAFA